MEESKELQGAYKIFRAVIYISLLVEFFEYAINPEMLDHWGGVLSDIHGRIKQWMIYQDGNLIFSKVATFLLICITCVGTRNKKHLEFDARKQVLYPLVSGVFLIALSVWLFGNTMDMRLYSLRLNIILYMIATIIGTVLVHIALDNISKFLKEGLLKDRFNFENESFEQCKDKQENKYSVNIPMRYYYKGKFRKGWVNIVNPFRGTWVVGTPGSGKTFSIIEPFIRQHSEKGFAMVVYDYKFPTLATKLYYHYKKNQKLGKLPEHCKFNIINFVEVEYSRRVNPIQQKYINNLAAASETAETLLESLQKGKKEGGGGSDQFFQTSAVNFLAACIYFFINYEKEPYDKNGKMLIAEKNLDTKTGRMIPTGRVFDESGKEVQPEYWLGKYSDMPHILSFLNESYQTIFEVLETDNEVAPLLGPFQTALKNRAMEQLEGMIGTLRVYTERVESGVIHAAYIADALKIVKSIGLLSLFGSSATSISKELLIAYAQKALTIKSPEKVIDALTAQKIIRFASYKSSYILFEGTDLNLEDELFNAANIVQKPAAEISNLSPYLTQKAIAVSEEYYRNGTPRYFEYVARNEAEAIMPQNDIDGYVQLVFPLDDQGIPLTLRISKESPYANIFVVFTNVDKITKHLYEIAKLQYLIENVVLDDRVAKKEIENQIKFEKSQLNSVINDSLVSGSQNCTWIYKGEIMDVRSFRDFNKLLSAVCKDVYSSTPILRNELFNKQKLSSAISLARVKLLDAMMENSDKEDFGFAEATCPPEKTIYYTIFQSTGIHRMSQDGIYILGEPQNDLIKELWTVCCNFISSTTDKPRKVSELIKILKAQPFKLKQGVIDFWIPIFLFIKQQDFAIYNSNGAYVMNITKEFFELLQKHPAEFTIKAFNVSGVKIEFFKKYRQFLRKDDGTTLGSTSFIETFKPFLQYYRSLNEYAKNTRKFENVSTAKFRDILAQAKDPEKAFFEDLPEAFGYQGEQLTNNQEFIEQYLEKIQTAVRELNVCYDNAITRIENRVKDELSLDGSYEAYKQNLENRYMHVKKHLLTTKCRTFLERILAPSGSPKEFYEKVCNVVIDKQLVQMRDKEEESLLDNLIFFFHELDRHVAISSMDAGSDEVFNFEIASTSHAMAHSQTYRLPEKQKAKAKEISQAIEALLTGDSNLDVCVLLKMLNEKLAK